MMEILKIIWSSLTTENPNIITVISIPLIFIEVYISMLIFTTLLNINATKKQKWLYVLIVSIFSIISRLIIPAPFNSFINLLVMFLSILFIFKTTFFRGIVCLVFPFIIETLLESVFANIYYEIFHIDYSIGGNIPLHRLVGTLIVYLVMFLVYVLLKHFKLNISKFEILDKEKE